MGSPIGVMVTLRQARAYEFLDRLINVDVPRLRDFHGVSAKSFDKSGNFNLGINDQSVFPELGVPRERVEQRIRSLTDGELAQFNRQLSESPAGGFIGIIVLFLVIFIITDMLCATDVFTFVKCINRR